MMARREIKLTRTADGYVTPAGWTIRHNAAAKRWTIFKPTGELVYVARTLRQLREMFD